MRWSCRFGNRSGQLRFFKDFGWGPDVRRKIRLKMIGSGLVIVKYVR